MWLFISCWLARGANMYSANHFYNLLQINFFPKNFFLQKFCNFGFDDVQWTTFVFDDCVGSFCTTFASVANISKAKKNKTYQLYQGKAVQWNDTESKVLATKSYIVPMTMCSKWSILTDFFFGGGALKWKVIAGHELC